MVAERTPIIPQCKYCGMILNEILSNVIVFRSYLSLNEIGQLGRGRSDADIVGRVRLHLEEYDLQLEIYERSRGVTTLERSSTIGGKFK